MAGTVRIPKDIYQEVKTLAQASGKPISRVVKDGQLSDYLPHK